MIKMQLYMQEKYFLGDDEMMDVSKLTNKELIEQYKTYYEQINVVCCFSVTDCCIFDRLEQEVNNRGLEIVQSVDVME